jgi:hypothetical protein
MKKIIVLVVLIVSLGLVFFSSRDAKKEDDKELTVKVEFICPMDCEHGKTYEVEGTCPICKMQLKKVEE